MAIRTPDSPRLPQPGWRLTGFASIGIGAGLLTADAPFAVLAAAFIPALISMIVIAAQATRESITAERVPHAIEEPTRTR